MSKTILLIENDAAFAEEMSGAIEAMGYQVRVTGDGKEGLDLAKDLRPDAIVLCVELPKLSGYSICNKLKKDDVLKAIPLVLTSSEATEEVFEDHRKLKVRAEDYLIKPYVSAALLEKVAGLIGLPEGAAASRPPREPAPAVEVDADDEEVVSLEEEMGLESFAGEPGQELPALDLDSLPDEPAAVTAGSAELDDDLKLLDDAFDGLSATPAQATSTSATARPSAAEARASGQAAEQAPGSDQAVASEDLDAAAASIPDEGEAGARAELGDVADEADLALESLGGGASRPAPSAFDAIDAMDEPSPAVQEATPLVSAAAAMAALGSGLAAGAITGASTTSAADLARLETELAERRAALNARETELRDLRTRLESAVQRADELESTLGEREAEAASLKARGDTLAAQARKAEADAKAARDEARRAAEQAREAEAQAAGAAAKVSAAEGRSRVAEQDAASQRRVAEQTAAALAAKSAELTAIQASAARLTELEREVERLESELVVARGELEGTRSEVERRVTEMKRRISELEATNAKNEERVVKAYLKIKGDEKVRDKARKALAIALQLLEEGLPAEAPGEKRPRPVPE
jgi:CheY-like chemotaxis protein